MKLLKTYTIAQRRIGRVNVALEFKLADLWIGVFFDVSQEKIQIWCCPILCVPVHITIDKKR